MLSIEGLTKTYPNGVRALKDVNLTIEKGLFGLLGPNGAGKSTLMRTLATLQPADQGTVHFDGYNISEQPRKLRRQLGYLPQDFGVYPKISAWDLLNHLAILKGLSDRKARTEQVASLLQQTNLYRDRKKAVAQFSGGMKQRFGIAQALLGNPRLIIVDEPTAGLDPQERNRFHNLLSDIGEQVVVILSTHIVEDVADCCRHMAILADGQVVAEGVPGKLVADLRGRLWRKAVPKRELVRYRSQFSVISTRLFGGQTQVHLLADQCPESGFEPWEPDLEDVYFSVLFRLQSERGGLPC